MTDRLSRADIVRELVEQNGFAETDILLLAEIVQTLKFTDRHVLPV